MQMLLHFVTLPSWWVMRSMDGSLTRFRLAESLDSDTAMALVSSAPVASLVAQVNSRSRCNRLCGLGAVLKQRMDFTNVSSGS